MSTRVFRGTLISKPRYEEALVEHLAGVHPGAGGLLGEDHANQAEHRPAGSSWSSHARKRTMSNASLKGCGMEHGKGMTRRGQRRVIETVEARADRRAPRARVSENRARETWAARGFRWRALPGCGSRRARSRRRRARSRERARSEARVREIASRGVRFARERRRWIRDARFARRFPGASSVEEAARSRESATRGNRVLTYHDGALGGRVVHLLQLADDLTDGVDRGGAVEGVQVELEVLHGLGEAEGVEAGVTGEGPSRYAGGSGLARSTACGWDRCCPGAWCRRSARAPSWRAPSWRAPSWRAPSCRRAR